MGAGGFDEQLSGNRRKTSVDERRVTDQVISRWEKAPTKFQMLQRLIGSRLWEHCFLLIPDEEFSFSAVVGYGSSAMLALGLTEGQINSIQGDHFFFALPKDLHKARRLDRRGAQIKPRNERIGGIATARSAGYRPPRIPSTRMIPPPWSRPCKEMSIRVPLGL